MSQPATIGIIGAGPMAVFLVKHLVTSPDPLRIVLFERHQIAGTGMPYSEEMSPDYMLANIFSREIPTIHQTLASWLRDQPAESLARWGVSPDDISARAFYPRTLLGAYLAAQLQALATFGAAAGHRVDVRTEHDVIDVIPGIGSTAIVAQTSEGQKDEAFDHVILATGHTWDATPTEGAAALVSPWPAANLATLPAGPIGILGSSLSAVDVAVALAHAHGTFWTDDDGLNWTPNPGHEALHLTMVSKTGILPEADFHYPYPYEPLAHLTEAAVDQILADGAGQILQRTFDLLMQEIAACDPAYMAELDLQPPTIEGFATAYFVRRQRMGAFRALRATLAESRETIRQGQTIASRYALLRGHEVFEAVLSHLTEDEWETFRSHLLPVFADGYAAVPHLSLERLAALRAADAIDAVNAGEEAQFLQGANGGVVVRIGDTDHSFAAMVDARGQAPDGLDNLPFPSLVEALVDATAPLDAPFHMNLSTPDHAPVFCLSMPQILLRHPFSQGLPNCDALAQVVADTVLRGISRTEGQA